MISSGSKGSLLNLVQVLGIVGQQTAWGERIPKTLAGGSRGLPHYNPEENSIEERGFVEHGYFEGLTNAEYFNHAYSARESVLNTAVDTPKIGELRRGSVKVLEDLHVAYDGSVRDGKNNVVQYVYGGDGMVASRLQKVQIGDRDIFLPIDFKGLASALNKQFGY
jgi:DNA-directed RNA polymerase II subunit RPB1